MKNSTKLQQEIAELTAKHQLAEYADSIFPTLDKLTLLGIRSQKRVIIRAKNKDEFKQVLTTLPPTNHVSVIGSSTSKEKELNVPFRLDIENPCAPNSYSKFILKIEYTHNDIELSIELPIESIIEFTTTGTRNITDSEYHYFTGTSYAELRKIKVRSYSFKSDQISWYGGNKTLTDEPEIENIISFLSK